MLCCPKTIQLVCVTFPYLLSMTLVTYLLLVVCMDTLDRVSSLESDEGTEPSIAPIRAIDDPGPDFIKALFIAWQRSRNC
jgi:hypothetical protein